jgi:prepilin-type N-terminal cleavage/methylation domain-containing protein
MKATAASFGRHRARARGVTLVELIVAIVVLGVVVAGLATGFATVTRSAPLSEEMHQALQLAQGRMELILYQKQRLGFATFSAANYDPCALAGTQQACLKPSADWTVTPAFAANWNGDTNYKVITVTVSDPPSGAQLAQLQALVANY